MCLKSLSRCCDQSHCIQIARRAIFMKYSLRFGLVLGFFARLSSQTQVLNFFLSFLLTNQESGFFNPGFQNPGFQFPVSNLTQYFIFQVSKFLTQKRLFLVYFNRPSLYRLPIREKAQKKNFKIIYLANSFLCPMTR